MLRIKVDKKGGIEKALKECQCVFAGQFPIVAEALGWTEHNK